MDQTQAMQWVGEILSNAEEARIIEGYGECPGVPRFDIETTDGKWVQIEVIG